MTFKFSLKVLKIVVLTVYMGSYCHACQLFSLEIIYVLPGFVENTRALLKKSILLTLPSQKYGNPLKNHIYYNGNVHWLSI